MTIILSILRAILSGPLILQHIRWTAKQHEAISKLAAAQSEAASLTRARDDALALSCTLREKVNSLAALREVTDANRRAEELRMQAVEFIVNAKGDAKVLESDARAEAEQIIARAKREASNTRNVAEVTIQAPRLEGETLVTNAERHAEGMIKSARDRAEQVAGDAYKAMNDAKSPKQVAKELQNVVDGYGDKYLKPTISLVDDLADEWLRRNWQQIKITRDRSKRMIDGNRAAACDYVEASRRDTAFRFVIDAFNGRVDSVLFTAKRLSWNINSTRTQQLQLDG